MYALTHRFHSSCVLARSTQEARTGKVTAALIENAGNNPNAFLKSEYHINKLWSIHTTESYTIAKWMNYSSLQSHR